MTTTRAWGAVLVALSLLWDGCGGGGAPAPAEPAKQAKAAGVVRLSADSQQSAGLALVSVTARQVAETIQANGQLTINEDKAWHVGAIAEGKLVAVLAKVGDDVKEGQVLAYMHSHAIHESRAAYKQALAERDRARSNLEHSRRVSARAGRLLKLQAISQEQWDQAENDVRTAEAAVRKADADVEKERQHLTEFLDVPIEDGGGTRLEDRIENDSIPIKAPAAGTIFKRMVSPGTVLSVGGEAFTIADTSTLWMIANLNEADLSGLRPGLAVAISVKAYAGREFHGRVLQLGEELDAETRTLRVRVLVPNQAGLLKPEMFATAAIATGAGRTALYVAEAAAQEVNGQRVVFVQTGAERFEPRAVSVARTVNGEMEIAEGLKAGDRVVVKGSFVLKSELLKSALEGE